MKVDIRGEVFEVAVPPVDVEWGFWDLAASGAWEPDTFDILDRFLTPDCEYVDVGAWIGPTVLYASRKARLVWAVEPDPVARAALNENLGLNGVTNVIVSPYAISAETGTGVLGTRTKWGDSQSSLIWSDRPDRRTVPTVTLETFCAIRDIRPALIKMDVEGGEALIIPDAAGWLAAHGYPVWLSVHMPWLADDAATRLRSAVSGLGAVCPDEFGTVLIGAA